MSAGVRRCDARGAVENTRTAVKSVTAAAVTATVTTATMAARAREGGRCERQAAERENCGQRND
jgi:hypothetical protein